MTNIKSTHPEPPVKTIGNRAAWALFWLILVLEVLTMALAGSAKFTGPEMWQTIFAELGYPSALALPIGAVEFAAALLLLVPRTASYAAVILSVVMLAALQAVVAHDHQLGAVMPVVHLVFLAVIGKVRWNRRWRSIG